MEQFMNLGKFDEICWHKQTILIKEHVNENILRTKVFIEYLLKEKTRLWSVIL